MSSTEHSPKPQFGRWTFDLVDRRWWWSPEIIAMWDIGLTADSGAEQVLERLHRRTARASVSGCPRPSTARR